MADAARLALLRVAAALGTRDAARVRRALEEARGVAEAAAVEEVVVAILGVVAAGEGVAETIHPH